MKERDRSPDERRYVVAHLLLGAVILLWGANWPVMKVGVQSIPPLWFAVARLLLGAVTLLLVLVAIGRLRIPRRGDWPVLLSVSALQMGTFLALINIALLYVEAGRSAILAYTTPLWVTPAAVLLLGERLTARRLAGLALGLSGIGILFNPASFDWDDPQAVTGNALLLAAALASAAAIVQVRSHSWVSSPLQLAPWQMLLATVPLSLLAYGLEGRAYIRWSPELIAILVYNGPVATAFCYWAAVTVTRSLPAIASSLGFLGVPVAGVLFSAVSLGEALSATLVAGLLLIVCGIGVISLPGLRRGRGEAGRRGCGRLVTGRPQAHTPRHAQDHASDHSRTRRTGL